MEDFTYLHEITWGGLSGLFAGFCVVLACSRALVEVLGLGSRHPARLACAYWVAAGAVVCGSVLMAGKTGLLSAGGIFSVQLAFLAGLLLCLRGRLGLGGLLRLVLEDAGGGARVMLACLDVRRWKQSPSWTPLLFRVLVALLGVLAVVAVLTPVINHDTHIYRFPRIGMWLQNNHIGHFETPKDLMNFSGRTGEFLVLWLVSFFKAGFPLVQLVQWAAGVATLAATYELARQAGFPRLVRWVAMFVVLGMPNVIVQFTTSQTDLTAASFATTGLVFVQEALRRRQTGAFLLAGLAFGLAVGTKQTMLVWGAAYAVLALAWTIRSPAGWKGLPRPVLLAVLVSLPFYLPLFWENHQAYGAWLVPESFLKDYPSLHEEERVGWLFYPAIWGWHLSWPAVQSPWLYPLTRGLHGFCLALAQRNVWVGHGDGLPQCASDLRLWMEGGRYGEDIVPPSLAVLGAVGLALPVLLFVWFRFIRSRSRSILFWETPGLPYLLAAWVVLACSLRYGWEIYSWRFWVIPAPLLVLAALSLPSLLFPHSRRFLVAWAVIFLFLHVPITFRGVWQHGNNGLMTLFQPERAHCRSYAQWMAEASRMLGRIPRKTGCTSAGFWSSILFRNGQKNEVVFLEPGKRVLKDLETGRFDAVLLQTDPGIDLARQVVCVIPPLYGEPIRAVRLLGPGEKQTPQALWKEGFFADGWIAPRATLLIERARPDGFRMSFRNLHSQPLEVEISGKRGVQKLTIPPGDWFASVLKVAPEDELVFKTALIFKPNPPDMRPLGVLVRIDELPPEF